ncbi:DUF2628 domain-containing protein [Antarcticirhabdus aurantiaca]|uniref:DUF2628 domain-containing protein n=1 Tax=Antarcticirhabdus aurantiaca TaxID=2606717 RepID=A0ACD4NPF9_9HYPH|nr:DUF2628 domain-containing protein [Antarcticirhabdus aurantiaca]WAJ28591.1 DUF2628 domain-containing protein [Jeongeuplla avenae]
MSAWTVFEPKDATGRTAGAVFLRDRFSIPAFLFGPFWLLWNRLWLEAIVVIALVASLGVLERAEGWALAGNVLPLLLALLIGLEGPERRAARLRRAGWREAGTVMADNRDEAELRYYAGATSRSALDSAAPAASAASAPAALAPRTGSFGGFFGGGRPA